MNSTCDCCFRLKQTDDRLLLASGSQIGATLLNSMSIFFFSSRRRHTRSVCGYKLFFHITGDKQMTTTSNFAAPVDRRYLDDYIAGSAFEFGQISLSADEIIDF